MEIGASFLADGEPADSHSTHKVTSVRESIEAAGARLLCLPTYLSELNPIKFAFANNKAIARSAAQAGSDFRAAIQYSLLALKPVECCNYYMAAGYEDETFASSRSGFGPIGSTSFMLRAPSYNSAPRPRGVDRRNKLDTSSNPEFQNPRHNCFCVRWRMPPTSSAS